MSCMFFLGKASCCWLNERGAFPFGEDRKTSRSTFGRSIVSCSSYFRQRHRAGYNIKRRRAELELTQNQLADKLEISTTYMGELEIASKNASFDVLQRLCEVLSMRPYEMFLEEGVDDQSNDSRDAIRNLTKEATLALNRIVKATLEEISQKHLK